ncbi:YqgQ family protein [Alkalicoccus urumqiensis]|uniref:DUF910 domain-containing protein n=1 Tax=Alkalicoccus urumqiensis TaxID=1548213 RepID=A0A2P6MK64_ALKUR|nr:YqgQ family protein [Alkalicoccus urumqiensis]PRO66679.1 DUF910 domain-containing protein [Alkalicoccus urumqiensis]
MMNYLDVLHHLRDSQAVIYTGNAEADCDLILDELKEQKEIGMIDAEFYQQAFRAVMVRRAEIKKKST